MQLSQNRKYFLLIIIAVSAVLSCLWYYHELQNQEPPFLTADTAPTRVKPDDPGGSISEDYKPIYDQLKNPTGHVKSVTLIPEPEEPLHLSSGATPQEDVIGNIVSNIVENKEQVQNQEMVEASSKSLNIVTIPHDKVTKATTATVKKLKSSYYIQLASTRTKEQANKEWGRISKAQSRLLSSIGYKVEAYNVEGKGRFYYLLAGPLRDGAHAKLLCKKLVNARQNCIIKKM